MPSQTSSSSLAYSLEVNVTFITLTAWPRPTAAQGRTSRRRPPTRTRRRPPAPVITPPTSAAPDHDQARVVIASAPPADPARAADGRPAELVYADRVEAWVAKLVPDGPPHLLL